MIKPFRRVPAYDLFWWIAVVMGVVAALPHRPIDDRAVARLAGESA